jgi:hydroxypyruvate isomerase
MKRMFPLPRPETSTDLVCKTSQIKLKFSANLSFLFNEVPFLDRFEAARSAGFAAVEYMFPYEFDAHELKARLDDLGLQQVLFNMPVPDWDSGGRGMLILPNRVAEFRQSVRTAIEYARVLGVQQVNCLSGLIPEIGADAILASTAVENLRYAASELGAEGIRLLLEPINYFDMPGFYLNTAGHVEELMDEAGGANIFIQFDIYHQQRMCGEIIATYMRLKDRIAHIQIADNPGRHEPGTGEINYSNVFRALKNAGYDGWIGCEYRPKTTTLEGLGWMRTEIESAV